MTNEQLVDILKATVSVDSSSNGIAAPQDADSFIDLAVEQTAVMREWRIETGIKTSFNLDSISLAEPVTVAGTEGVAPAAGDVVEPLRTRKILAPVEVVAAFDVSYSFLRKNIEGNRVNETLNTLFAKRFGKDLVTLTTMGDTDLDTSTRTNKLLRILDGVIKLAVDNGDCHEYEIPVTPSYTTQVFPAMVMALPKDYRDSRDDLRFFVSADVYDAYADEIGSRPTTAGDAILVGSWDHGLSFKGIPLVPTFGMDSESVILTPRDNIAIGFGQEMTVGKDLDNRARLLKVTITADVACNYAVGDALVLGQPA